MNTSSIASVASQMAATEQADAVNTAMLRKALDMQAQQATQLLEAIPETPQYNNPPNLGNNVDVRA